MQTLSKKQAKNLFRDNSVYINGHDVMPLETVEEFFEKDAWEYAKERHSYEVQYVGEFDPIICFDFDEFMNVVSYHNVEKMLER